MTVRAGRYYSVPRANASALRWLEWGAASWTYIDSHVGMRTRADFISHLTRGIDLVTRTKSRVLPLVHSQNQSPRSLERKK